MNSLYPSPSLAEKEEDQPQPQQHHHHHRHLKLFLFKSSNQASSSSLSCANCFPMAQDHRGTHVQGPATQAFEGAKEDTPTQVPLSSQSARDREEDQQIKSEVGSSWTSSKMRLMQKMMTNGSGRVAAAGKPEGRTTSDINTQRFGDCEISSPPRNIGNNGVRVCSDCNTTTTPLWRSGPQGPKSLCNACGIRQRKARRAMAEATVAGGRGLIVAAAAEAPFLKQSKEKKCRRSNMGRHENVQCKVIEEGEDDDEDLTERKLSFNNFALGLRAKSLASGRVFPQDEEEGAILLMELSCGHFET